MTRKLTPQSSLDVLKKEAKRWLKALRENDPEARARLVRAFPQAPAEPGLRDVQYALALEHGLAGWNALKHLVAGNSPETENRAELVHWFLENACPDHHVRGGPDHVMARHTAVRILSRHPEIARDSIYTAVVCGDLPEVRRILAERPQAATERSSETSADRSDAGGSHDRFRKNIGPKGWDPLLYLCFTRLPLAAANDNALAIAQVLLDRGADPNAYFMAGNSRYTPLVGVIGEGEEERPPHPQREALTKLLLERGAEPYDIQVFYNVHFRGDILWLLDLIYVQALKLGRQADWDDPEWPMIDMGGYGFGARYLLGIAVEKNDLQLAKWLLEHGASPNAAPPSGRNQSQRTMHEEALRRGHQEIAELLVRYGATPVAQVLEGEEAFAAACFRLDHAEARKLLYENPEYLRSPRAMFACAKRDRADAVALLLDLGMSPDIEDPSNGNQRPLHEAAYNDSIRVAQLLIERGAAIDPVDSMHDGTPLWFAMWGQRQRTMDLLSRYSRDIWALSFMGKVERLREILSAEPGLAKLAGEESTPLMWLPDDEKCAREIVELFLSHGADPTIKNKDGMTAADLAAKRGLDDAAELLRSESPTTHQPLDKPAPAQPGLEDFERIAEDIVEAYASGNVEAMRRIRDHTGRNVTLDELRSGARQALGMSPDAPLSLPDAQLLVARFHGFESWQALDEHFKTSPETSDHDTPNPGAVESAIAAIQSTLLRKRLRHEPYIIDWKTNTIKLRPRMKVTDADEVIAIMTEKRITGLNAEGHMTDDQVRQISELNFVTHLDLGDSKRLTDAGLVHLSSMPQLRELNLSGYPGGKITDRGLEFLRHLPELRRFQMCWQRGISDAGVANLAYCDHLESVDLLGTPTGDGAIRALAGKAKLRRFKTGRLVTDAGLPLLHQFPVFKTWQGGDLKYSLTSPDAEPNHLLVDGPFTDEGLAGVVGLEGLFGFSVFWHVSALTADGLKPLIDLPNLGFLGCEGKLCNDMAMRHIGAMPHLRMLMAQGTVASDAGFAELSRSQTVEYIWGRECPNLTGPGFTALAMMPALRGLAVSCKSVDDAGLSALPRFPALRELMPMDVPDEGYRHVGRCEQLESLVLMYCRDTTDVATEHIAGLANLKSYFASYTKITDRSMEILSRMPSLERISFYGCAGVTIAGVAALARLPRLREVEISGPKITREVAAAFPANVRVEIGD